MEREKNRATERPKAAQENEWEPTRCVDVVAAFCRRLPRAVRLPCYCRLVFSRLDIEREREEREKERRRKPGGNWICPFRSFVLPGSLNLSFSPRNIFAFSPFSLRHVQKPATTTTTAKKMDKSKHEQKLLAYGSFACGYAQSSHSLLSISLLLAAAAASTTASCLQASRRSCVFVVTIAETFEAYWSNWCMSMYASDEDTKEKIGQATMTSIPPEAIPLSGMWIAFSLCLSYFDSPLFSTREVFQTIS